MRAHPILMQGPLVRATLEGRKTQTRRPVKGNPPGEFCGWIDGTDRALFMEGAHGRSVTCPFGKVGDRLWVRETFAVVHPCRDVETGYIDDIMQPRDIPKDNAAGFWVSWYRAAWKGDDGDERGFRWLPSIHMPRWACRLILPLVSVRVERVQDITEADARAEGFPAWWEENKREWDDREPNPVDWFAELWESLYGDWAENPWVWVAEWKEIEVRK